MSQESPGVSPSGSESSSSSSESYSVSHSDSHFVPLPSSVSLPHGSSASLTPIVCDEKAIGRLLGTMIKRSGLSIGEATRRLGLSPNALRQYLNGRRKKPSLMWFIRLANLCGAKVSIEFPKGF